MGMNLYATNSLPKYKDFLSVYFHRIGRPPSHMADSRAAFKGRRAHGVYADISVRLNAFRVPHV